MKEFFKREFGPYFRDFSEYDFKFFRTLRDAFLRPTKVIEANDGTYTGELKFTFNIFTVLFIIFYFSEPSWVESIGSFQLWKYTLPHQNYLALEQGIEEDYYGYIQAIAFVPLYFMFMKLLFYRKKPWGFFLSAAFYLSSVIFSLLIVVMFLIDWLFPNDEGLIPAVLVVFVSIYPVIALRIGHWFLSGIKGIIATVIPLVLISLFLENSLSNLALNLLSSEKAYEMHSSDKLLTYKKSLNTEVRGLQQVIMEDSSNIFLLGFDHLSYLQNDTSEWTRELTDLEEKRMTRIDDDKLLVACFHKDDQDKILELVVTLYSSRTGDTLVNHQMTYHGVVTDLSSQMTSDSSFNVYVGNIQSNFQLTQSGWSISETTEIESKATTYTYYPIDSATSIRSAVHRPQVHISEMTIEALNNGEKLWEHTVYSKFTPFDPIDPLTCYLDISNRMVYSHYTLANDSMYAIHLSAINIDSGELQWQSSFYLDVNLSEFVGFKGDNNYLYLYGEGHKFYSNWFWQPTYHIGMIVRVDLESGLYENHAYFGPDNRWGIHSRIMDIVSSNGTLYFVSRDVFREPFFDENTGTTYMKGIDREF